MKYTFSLGGCQASVDAASMAPAERAKIARQLFDKATPEEVAQTLILLDQHNTLDVFLAATGVDFDAACQRAGLFDRQPAQQARIPMVTEHELEVAGSLNTADLRKLLEAKGMM